MPTRCIELWFEGEISPVPATKVSARSIARRGLEGTYFDAGEEKFRKLALKYERQVREEKAQPTSFDINVPVSDEEFRISQLIFCEWDTEIDYGLRKEGNLFGTTLEPPEAIKTQLEQVRKSQSHLLKGI